jgi:hypothetical protein
MLCQDRSGKEFDRVSSGYLRIYQFSSRYVTLGHVLFWLGQVKTG